MRAIDVTVAGFVLAVAAGPARAAPATTFVVPAGSLDQAIRTIGAQGQVDIGSAEPGLAAIRVPALRLKATPQAALARLLRDTAFMAVAVDARSFRIVRRPLTTRVQHRPAPPPPAPEPADDAPTEVIVTASKVQTALLRFPGSAVVLPVDRFARAGASASRGFGDLAASLPILQTTSQGPGRDKIFVRGISDSSFAGPTQSTATVYFGDVQLGYNGPDPSLSLYDVASVEVLEGPQGTLYGAGAIGGIIRVEPQAPDLTRTMGQVTGGLSSTRSGDVGYDGAAMLNVPLADGRVALRAVGYRSFDGGYIDDPRRGLADINDVTTTGGRVALRGLVGPWTIDTGIVAQRIHAADLQYAQRGLPELSHAALLAQPFSQKYALGRFVANRQWDDGLRLVVATGLVHHNAADRLDASRRGSIPIAYDVSNRSRLFTQEVRLSRSSGPVRWLTGLSLVRAHTRYSRELGPIDQQREIVGVLNRATTLAAFGEATVAVAPRLSLTAGGRATYARTDGEPIAARQPGPFFRGRTSERFDPTFAMSWLAAPSVAVFGRIQSGFRTGGIAVAPGVGRVADFDADTVRVTEVGIRKDRTGTLGFSGSASLSLTDWDKVQADLISRGGFPYTANVGSARIRGVEFVGDWVPLDGLRINAAMFFNSARIDDPVQDRRALPMAPRFSSSAGVDYRWSAGGRDWTVKADVRQVGPSLLGSRPPLDLVQRGYVRVGAGAAVTLAGGIELSARIDNLFDAAGDRFASGNSFGIVARDQYTPLRPRTLRIGFAIPLGDRDGARP